MSEFEAATSSSTRLIAIVVIVIIGVAGVSFIVLGGLPGPTTTPTDTTTTTTTTGPSGPVTLKILTRHDVAIHNVYEPAFLNTQYARDNNIENIDWLTPDSSFWDDLIDQNGADICWGGGPTIFDQLWRDGRLGTLESTLMQTVAARVPDELAGTDMKRYNDQSELVWIAAAISSFGFTIDTDFLTTHSLPTPTNWTDLAKPIYGSLLPAIPTIGMGNAPDTTSNTRIYEIMTQGLGWDEGWINMARMAGSSNIYGGSVDVQLAVRTGEVGIGMTIDFYGFQNQRLTNNTNIYILPEDQTIINGDPIAIPSTSPHPNHAEAFLDFVLSVEGQLLWLDDSILRMPVMEEAFWDPRASEATALYESFNRTTATAGIDFNDSLSLEINSAFIFYHEAVFKNSHTELIQCWSEMLALLEAGHINEAELDSYAVLMGTPVSALDATTSVLEKFTLAYAQQINDAMIYDSSYASQMKTRWTNAAKSQYISVYNTLLALWP
ncbi:MAG: ABC transporter substrate-binding protein [Candidatus Thorarchaeota archaeon]|jgi:ABC-type Fe3+ transport system substrate-binding protein